MFNLHIKGFRLNFYFMKTTSKIIWLVLIKISCGFHRLGKKFVRSYQFAHFLSSVYGAVCTGWREWRIRWNFAIQENTFGKVLCKSEIRRTLLLDSMFTATAFFPCFFQSLLALEQTYLITGVWLQIFWRINIKYCLQIYWIFLPVYFRYNNI